MLPTVFSANVTGIYGVYTAAGKVRFPACVTLVSGFLGVLISFVLLKFTNMGVYAVILPGAILTSLRSAFFMPMYAAYNIGINIWTFVITAFRQIASFAVIFALFAAINHFITISSWFDLILVGIVCGAFGLVANFFVAFNKKDRKDVISLIKSKLPKRASAV